MRYTTHITAVQEAKIKAMTDEQLATADELIRDTMREMEREGDRPILMKLFEQQCAINREAKDRMAAAQAARRAERMYPIPPHIRGRE